jgi:hypothetical protein
MGWYYSLCGVWEQMGILDVNFGRRKVAKLYFMPIMAVPLFFKEWDFEENGRYSTY